MSVIKEVNFEFNGPELYNNSGNFQKSFDSALSEFIDNSIQSGQGMELVNILINVTGKCKVNKKAKKKDDDIKHWTISQLEIIDDGCGIKISDIERVFKMAEPTIKDGLNEKGMGFKTAASKIGVAKIQSKHIDDKDGWRIDEFNSKAYGTNKVKILQDDIKKGTHFTLTNINPIIPSVQKYWINLAEDLGFIYSSYLYGNDLKRIKARITINLIDYDDSKNNKTLNVYPRSSLFKDQSPKIDKTITGKNWSIKLKFGFNPDQNELQSYQEQEGFETVGSRNSKLGKISEQLIHIKYQGKVFPENHKYGLFSSSRLASYFNRWEMSYTLEITCLTGFESSTSKDSLAETESRKEMIETVANEIMPYLTQEMERLKENRQNSSEDAMKDKIEVFLKNQGFNVRREVCDEFGGKKDLLVKKANDTKYLIKEVKNEKAGYQDVAQTVFYVKMISRTNSFIDRQNATLIAPGFTIHAKNLLPAIEQEFGVKLTLELSSNYGCELKNVDEVETEISNDWQMKNYFGD